MKPVVLCISNEHNEHNLGLKSYLEWLFFYIYYDFLYFVCISLRSLSVVKVFDFVRDLFVRSNDFARISENTLPFRPFLFFSA